MTFKNNYINHFTLNYRCKITILIFLFLLLQELKP